MKYPAGAGSEFNWPSHVFTVDPKADSMFELGLNTIDAVKTGQLEKSLNNWSMNDPGQMWLYDTNDAAHEFMHLLGLGDAYGADYRQHKEADDTAKLINDYGEEVKYSVPYIVNNTDGSQSGDIARGGIPGPDRVTDADVAILANWVW